MTAKAGNLKRLVASEWPKWDHVPFYEVKVPWAYDPAGNERQMLMNDFFLFEGEGAFYIKRNSQEHRIYGFTDLKTATLFKLRFG